MASYVIQQSVMLGIILGLMASLGFTAMKMVQPVQKAIAVTAVSSTDLESSGKDSTIVSTKMKWIDDGDILVRTGYREKRPKTNKTVPKDRMVQKLPYVLPRKSLGIVNVDGNVRITQNEQSPNSAVAAK